MDFPVASWPGLLRILTLLGSVLLLGLTLVMGSNEATRLVAGLPLGIWALCLWYSVRGFHVSADTLVIRRLLIETRIPLAALERVEHTPSLLMNARRRFGNNGLFAFVGTFHNEALGAFRLYATDPNKAVILYFADQVVVVTPANPEAFMQALPVKGAITQA